MGYDEDEDYDWGEDAFHRLQQKEGQAHEANQQYAIKRHQIMANAPILWNKLVSKIKEGVNSFTQRRPGYLTVEDSSGSYNDQFIVVRSLERSIEISQP